MTAAHEDLRSQTADLSEEGLYWGCKSIDGSSSPGASFEAAAAALERWGQPQQQEWPYDSGLTDRDPIPPPPNGPPDLRRWHRARLEEVTCDAEAVKSYLDHSSPVILGLRIGYEFAHSVDGRIPPVRPPGSPEFLHAVLGVGYTDADLIIRNSWGSSWGDNGYAYLPFEYLSRYGVSAWKTSSV